MGKKKPFIDKKTASVYHVVRRSQRDVGTEATSETLSDFVLMPSPDNAAREERRHNETAAKAVETASVASPGSNNNLTTNNNKRKVDFETLKSQITAAGLLDTTSTTYTQHTKPIQPSGTFIPTTNGYLHAEDADNLKDFFTDTTKNDLDDALEEAMAVHEVGRMLDSIALTADCMEEDMAHALFDDFEDGEFEEILDDFCLTANEEVLEDDEVEDKGEFNFEQHVQRLMDKARARENGEGEGGRDLEDDFFGNVTPLHGRIEEEEGEDDFDYNQYGEEEDEDSLDREFNGQESGKEHSVQSAVSDEQQRVQCQKFEQALLEYDSDDVGDLDEECEEIGGDRPLEGDTQLEAALNEFLTENKDEILIEGSARRKEEESKRKGGSGYSALVGKTMVHASELDENGDMGTLLVNMEESKMQMQKDLAEADATLANPEVDLPPEEVFIDGKSYFSVTQRSQWDCESILSTYSNLDNNPVVIGRSKKKGKKKKKALSSGDDMIPENGVAKIQLSNKTGLPLGVFDNHDPSPEEEYDYYDESDTYLSVNRGESRNKQESKMEKKARKLAIKEERKICRMQKKMLKEAFREEFQRRGTAEVVDAVGGNTVFRFS
mmetsp:Transcript_3850/g.8441  ORF Transcript_3850/g.8441 Transcript_3850/m.8441 type:complete len:608 (+) Transcript_3850:93-1916(+)